MEFKEGRRYKFIQKLAYAWVLENTLASIWFSWYFDADGLEVFPYSKKHGSVTGKSGEVYDVFVDWCEEIK